MHRAAAMRLLRLLTVSCGLLILPAASVAAGTPGTVLKDSPLLQQPYTDARRLATLKARTPVEVLERNGGWLRVNAAGKQGWLRLLNVRTGSGSAGNVGKDTAAVATGRAGSGNIASTSGIRGLDEAGLRAAHGDVASVAALDPYAATDAGAVEFARRARVVPRKLDYLPSASSGGAAPSGGD